MKYIFNCFFRLFLNHFIVEPFFPPFSTFMIMKKHSTMHALSPAADKPATEALNIEFAPLVAGFYDARHS